MFKFIKAITVAFFTGLMPTTVLSDEPTSDPIRLILPKHRLQANELGLIINTRDPVSVQIGKYYQQQRNIPDTNVAYVEIDPANSNLAPGKFESIFTGVTRQLGDNIQALALTWTSPYKVNCMSITSAFAFGYDPAYCSSKVCARTRPSGYFNSHSTSPYSDIGIRPTMSIAAAGFQLAKQLIDRGKASDGTNPTGDAYLVSTSDRHRNVRSALYSQIEKRLSSTTPITVVNKNVIKNKNNILFYFTGLKYVPFLGSLSFTPGAVADHLTSTGGRLTNSSQMSALRWLEAGATGSYGTVVEPCNLTAKFPNPFVLMDTYLYGTTLIEAYWKSVQQPGEGIFIGDPLAAPFDGYTIRKSRSTLTLETRILTPGLYRLSQALEPIGPFHILPRLISIQPHQTLITLPLPDLPVIKLEHVYPHKQVTQHR